MLESLRSEFDLIKNQQKHQMEQQQTQLERNHALELSDLKNKVSLCAVFIFKSSMFFSSLYEAEFASGFIHLPCFYPIKFKYVTFYVKIISDNWLMGQVFGKSENYLKFYFW